MPTEEMQKLLDRHAIERLSMEVRHAQDWVEFYETVEPNETLKNAWTKTLKYRLHLLTGATQHANSATTS